MSDIECRELICRANAVCTPTPTPAATGATPGATANVWGPPQPQSHSHATPGPGQLPHAAATASGQLPTAAGASQVFSASPIVRKMIRSQAADQIIYQTREHLGGMDWTLAIESNYYGVSSLAIKSQCVFDAQLPVTRCPFCQDHFSLCSFKVHGLLSVTA